MPEFKKLTLDELLAKRHPENPKEHNLPDLIDSIKRFGFVAFPTLDEASDTLVAGHGRCEALAAMKLAGDIRPNGIDVDASGNWLVPTIYGVSFADENERDAYIIADNAHVMNGSWSLDRLSSWVGRLDALPTGDGLQGIGLPAVDLQSLLGKYEEPESKQEEDEEPTVQHDIDVKTTFCCPSCGHKWEEEKKSKRKKKRAPTS